MGKEEIHRTFIIKTLHLLITSCLMVVETVDFYCQEVSYFSQNTAQARIRVDSYESIQAAFFCESNITINPD